MANKYERKIIATLNRVEGNKRVVVWTRTYVRFDTAAPRAVELGLLTGQPGDVVQISSILTGLEIGTVKIHAGGKIVVQWLWDEKK